DAAAHASNPSVFEQPSVSTPGTAGATPAPIIRSAAPAAAGPGAPAAAPRTVPGVAMGPPDPPKKPGLFGR
ncbi:MAG: poly(3-hydroxyalkanoate) granule-associated protein PhaF, partial [Candidatus Eisenbacteria bacterium]